MDNQNQDNKNKIQSEWKIKSTNFAKSIRKKQSRCNLLNLERSCYVKNAQKNKKQSQLMISLECQNLVQQKIERLQELCKSSTNQLVQIKNEFQRIKVKFTKALQNINTIIDNGTNFIKESTSTKIESLQQILKETSIPKLYQDMKSLKQSDPNSSPALFFNTDKIKEQIGKIFQEMSGILNQQDVIKNFLLATRENYDIQQEENSIKKKVKIDQVEKKKENILSSTPSYKLIFEQRQIRWCFALAANKEENILVCGQGSDIYLWQFEEGQLTQKQQLRGHIKTIRCLCFSKKTNLFISGSDDSTLRIWKELKSSQWDQIQILEEFGGRFLDIVFSNDDEEFISCSSDNKIQVWIKQSNSDRWECKQTMTEHNHPVFMLCLNPSNSQMISCGSDKLSCWEKGNDKIWKKKKRINSPKNDPYQKVCFVNDNQIIATTANSRKLVFLEQKGNSSYYVVREAIVSYVPETTVHVFPIAYLKQQKIIVCRHNSRVMIITQNDREEFTTNQVLYGQHNSRYLSKNGEFLILAEGWGNTLQIWQRK